jgi:hypothetical protein
VLLLAPNRVKVSENLHKERNDDAQLLQLETHARQFQLLAH